jgi:hypothetical protein
LAETGRFAWSPFETTTQTARRRSAPNLSADAHHEPVSVNVLSGAAPPPSLADLVPRIAPRPLFLIYAGQGGGGEELNPDYYDAASTPKTLWKISEAGHGGGYQARPHEYEERVTTFLDRALLGSR